MLYCIPPCDCRYTSERSRAESGYSTGASRSRPEPATSTRSHTREVDDPEELRRIDRDWYNGVEDSLDAQGYSLYVVLSLPIARLAFLTHS